MSTELDGAERATAADGVSGRLAYAGRRVPWLQLAGAAMLCALLLLGGARTTTSAIEMLPLVRIASLTLATTAVFALHDPSEPVTDTSPAGRFRVRTIAAALACSAAAGVWAVLIALTDSYADSSLRSMIPGTFVEMLAMLALAVAVAAAMQRVTSVRLAPAWGAAAVVLIVAATLTEPRVRAWLWVDPGPDWSRAHRRWAAIGVVGVSMFAWWCRDPARRSLWRGVNRNHESMGQRDNTSA